jgi:hypothetical protein
MRYPIITAAILAIACPAAAMKIHRDSLNEFHASVTMAVERDAGQILSGTFDEISIASDFDPPRRGRVNYRDGEEIRAWVRGSVPGYEVRSRSLLIVPLQDEQGFERRNHILSFWWLREDSLEFAFFDPVVRVGSIGPLAIQEVLDLGDDGLVIVTYNEALDAGAQWGRYHFAACDPDKKYVRYLYSEEYAYEWRTSETDTLRYELIVSGSVVTARMIRQVINWQPEPDASGPNDWVRSVADTDTNDVVLLRWED